MAAALACGAAAGAQTITDATNFVVGAAIPDGDKSGLASAQTISSPITSVTGLKVSLKLSGTWNGDLYCFLTHGAGHCVLLDRPGRSVASELGYNDVGLDVTFDDAATNGDIHVYRLQFSGGQGTAIAAPLTGAWAPDGRVTSPINALETDERSAFLSSFNGTDPNGEWVLFVADLETGDLHTLESWGLEITGDTAPAGLAQRLSQSADGSQAVVSSDSRSGASPAADSFAGTTPAAPALLKGLSAGPSAVKLTFTGSPSRTYQVERAEALQDGRTVWKNIGTATTDSAGQGRFTDANPLVGQGFCRAVWP